jgi:hypothetical protein
MSRRSPPKHALGLPCEKGSEQIIALRERASALNARFQGSSFETQIPNHAEKVLMNIGKVSVGLVVAFISAIPCSLAFSQSTVAANQGTYIYVDGATGSDSNPGTSAKPFKTIQAGVNKALAYSRSGVATTVDVEAGVYREAVTIAGKTSSASMTVRAATPGSVYIDGADVLAKWYKSGSSVYAFPWADSVEGCSLPAGWYTGMPPISLRNEMIFVNGISMTQVMSASQLVPGTFYVNGPYQEVDVYPPSGTDMDTAEVEVSARQATLTVNASRALAITGLVFQHAASCMNVSGANVFSSSNILLDDVQANWNNWGGLGISGSSGITVENSIGSYNGGLGFGAFEDVDALYENNETDYNNWRGAMVALYDVAMGGTKLMQTHTVDVSGQQSYNNAAEGLHFDTDNMNVTIDGAHLVHNLVENLQLEASQGPFTVENSSFCTGGTGINLINAADVTITNNHFYDNGNTVGNLVQDQNAQVFLAGKAGGRIVTNFQTGAETNVYTSNTKMEDNTFTAVGAGQYVFNTYLSGEDWSKFIDTLHSSDNEWYDSANSTPFGLPDGQRTSFAGWKSVADDTTSAWALSSEAAEDCGVPAPAYPDFGLYAHDNTSYVSSWVMSGGKLSIPLQVRSFSYGTVELSVSGLPSGVSASFSPSTLVDGSSTLTLSASSSAKSETVAITVFGISGSRVHTITFWVAVRPA